METAFLQQFRRHDDDFMPRMRWADDGMRTGYVIARQSPGVSLDAAAALSKCDTPLGLKQDFDVRMLACLHPRNRKRNAMLTGLDVTEL